MPLVQSPSKKALQKNIKIEMKANPSPDKRKQNLAIAYATKRRNMYSGGEAQAEATAQRSDERRVDQNCEHCQGMAKGGPACMYHGGLAEDPGHNTPMDELDHIERGTGKPHQEDQVYAQGGEVSGRLEEEDGMSEKDKEEDTMPGFVDGGMVNPKKAAQGDDHDAEYPDMGVADRILKRRKESLPTVDSLDEDESQEMNPHSDLESAQELEHEADDNEAEWERKRTWERAMSRRNKSSVR